MISAGECKKNPVFLYEEAYLRPANPGLIRARIDPFLNGFVEFHAKAGVFPASVFTPGCFLGIQAILAVLQAVLKRK